MVTGIIRLKVSPDLGQRGESSPLQLSFELAELFLYRPLLVQQLSELQQPLTLKEGLWAPRSPRSLDHTAINHT